MPRIEANVQQSMRVKDQLPPVSFNLKLIQESGSNSGYIIGVRDREQGKAIEFFFANGPANVPHPDSVFESEEEKQRTLSHAPAYLQELLSVVPVRKQQQQ